MKQTILLTALPIDDSAGGARIGVFVSPRLEPNSPDTLSKFENFLNWPTTLRNSLSFSVTIGAQTFQTKRVSTDPDEGLWDSLFKKTTPVEAFAVKPLHNRVLRSFPVTNVLTHIEGLYRAVAETSPAGLPVYEDGKDNGANDALIDFINDIGVLVQRIGSSTRGSSNKIPEPLGPAIGASIYGDKKVLDFDTQFNSLSPQQKKLSDFALAVSFHDRPGRQTQKTDPPFPKLTTPELEFHQIVAALASYPEIMKRLGLVFELQLLDTTGAPIAIGTLPASGKIRVQPNWTTPAPAYHQASKQPWTNFKVSGGRFMAMARPGGDLDNGMILLGNAHDRYLADKGNTPVRFALLQVDPDGAAMKAVDFAMNFARLRSQNKPYTIPDTAGLPALRTSGIGLVRHNRAYGVWQNLQTVAARNLTFVGGGDTELYLDDIVRGYRVDIRDGAGEWHTLTARRGYYKLTSPDPAYTGDNPLQIVDEGYVAGSSASSDLAGSPDLYLHEAMFRWEGWSLAAPKPGKTIVRQDADPNQPPEVPGHRQNSAAGVADVYVEANFRPLEKSLPLLRYGHDYRMRVRTADLGGYGPTLKGAPTDAKYLSNVLHYSRFEPVSQPFIVLTDQVREGESAERMVIRSNYDKTASEYTTHAQTTFGATFKPDNTRWLAPPKTSQLIAETHGEFDALIKAGNVEQAYNLAHKEEGTFLDVTIVDPSNPSTPIVVTDSLILNSPATPAPPESPIKRKVLRASEITDASKEEVWTRGAPLAPGQYVIHTGPVLRLPYLPDPIARGCAIEGFRDVAGNGTIPGGAAKVELPAFGPFDRPYHVVKVPFDGAWPDRLPFKIIIRERPGKMEGDNCDETFNVAVQPPEWDSTSRVLTVYLGKAEVMRLRYSSYINKSDLSLMGIWKWLDGSPKRNDFEPYGTSGVSWMVTPYRELTLVHAVQQPLCAPRIVKYAASKSLGETFATFKGQFLLNVASTGRLDVKGNWEEWVDPVAEPEPRRIKGTAQVYHADVAETLPNNLPVPFAGAKLPSEFRHEFNDTRYRKVDYNLVGTTRFREYFPQSIWADPTNLTREGEPYKGVKVLNSARPAMPKVLYIVPTFGWQVPPAAPGAEIVSRRCGGGLRVYLDRPWYSSGDDELLGIVLYKGTSMVPDDSPLRPYVTQWGMDPVMASFPTYAYTQIGHFKSFEEAGYDVTLDELTGETVHVVGYKPEFDKSRRLWYCDIEVDAGPAYYPFIRLALTRFQPNSVADAHLSRVVMTDFAQLAADRAASIVFETSTAISIYVSGSYGLNEATATASDKLAALGMSRVFIATLEEQSAASDEVMSWRPVSKSTVVTLNPHYEKEFEFKMLWQGRMLLPEEPIRSGGTKIYRVVITEWEYLDSDDRADAVKVSGRTMSKRLVYADAIKL